jgi:hypothetical protein
LLLHAYQPTNRLLAERFPHLREDFLHYGYFSEEEYAVSTSM